MEQVQTAAEALARLEQPFASKDVKWLVAATSKDGRKGRVTPYADPRAYTDRLNEVVSRGDLPRSSVQRNRRFAARISGMEAGRSTADTARGQRDWPANHTTAWRPCGPPLH